MATVGQVVLTDDKKRAIDIHLPFLNKERLYLVGNKAKRTGDNQPNFKVFGLYGEVGGVWDKISEKQKPYKSMSIDSPFGLLSFAIFECEKQEQVKNGTKTHFIVYSSPRPRDTFSDNTAQSNQSSKTDDNKVPEIDINEDEIPF
jgi:uncharacterized protein (DUF736 family)